MPVVLVVSAQQEALAQHEPGPVDGGNRAGREGEQVRTAVRLAGGERVRRYVDRVDNLARPDGLVATSTRGELEPWAGFAAGAVVRWGWSYAGGVVESLAIDAGAWP